MGLVRGDDTFFRNTSAGAELLAERSILLGTAPHLYLASLPEAAPLIAETIAFARSLNPGIAADSIHSLGGTWEPDFLLLHRDTGGRFRLCAGCVCFPSHWALDEKIGLTLEAIHAPVPTLNETFAHKIDAFLASLRPGTIWERANWGLAATPELNNHPALKLPRLTSVTPADDIWLRVERQAFRSLPANGGILFAIRLEITPLSEILQNPTLSQHLAEQLETMPPEIAAYKGLTDARASIARILRREK